MTGRLWFGILVGPLAWAFGLNANYAFVQLACEKSNALPLHGVAVLTLLLALSGLWVSFGLWRELGEEPPREGGGVLQRARFMVAVGILSSALFALTIVAQWIVATVLHPCMGI